MNVIGHINPFEVALDYYNKYWKGVLYLPLKEKHPPPTGFTGHTAGYPRLDEVEKWIAESKGNKKNIGLRLAGVDANHEIIGIDVDDYKKGDKEKHGGDQLEELEDRLGKLPDTWISSARTDGVSGIRYYLVPRGLAFKGQVEKDIECISKGYRYGVVWPSIHPEGTAYWWFPPGVPLTKVGTKEWDGEIPHACELPKLPEKWIEYLTSGRKRVQIKPADMATPEDQIYQWASDTFHGGDDADMCYVMREALTLHKEKIRESSSLHGLLNDAYYNLPCYAFEGHLGLKKAIDELDKFVIEEGMQKHDRTEDGITQEIRREYSGTLRILKSQSDERKAIKAALIDPKCTTLGGVCQTGKVVVNNEQHSGQLRMAYRFADKYNGKLLHVYGLGWHYWDNTRWAFDDKGKAHRMVIGILKQAWASARKIPKGKEKNRLIADVKRCESSTGINSILSIASKLKEFAVTVEDLDQNPYLLNVANGTLNLRNMNLRSHNPNDRITKICRAAYRPEVTSLLWDSFLERVLPDEQVRFYLQRLSGVALLGTVTEHVLPILTGEGRNGKGTWYEAVLHAMGDYGGIAEPDLFMHRDGAHPTGQMDLRGNRLVVVSENDKNRRLAEATMKRLTGGDPIKARHMRQDFVTFEASHMAMLITNHLPRVSGDDPAVWARMRVIPFDVVIPLEERDVHLIEKLKEVADAVLAWSLAGLQQYDVMGTAEPEAVLVATERYRSDSDDVAMFISECCVTEEDARDKESTTKVLFQNWENWQRANGCPVLGMHAFSKALENKGYPVHGAYKLRRGLGIAPDQPISIFRKS